MGKQATFSFYDRLSPYAAYMEEDPYFIRPELFYQIGVSGGRTSAYLLYQVLERNGGLPENARAIFTNTGKEREETLEFVAEIERQWNVSIIWLEFERNEKATGYKNDPKNLYRIVTFETASRKGEPFELAMKARKSIPGTGQRFCTSMLKIYPSDRYLKYGLGWKDRSQIRKLLGIRADEEKRAAVAFLSECPVRLPLLSARVTGKEIAEFWEEQPFNLQLENTFGNCDLCFMKSINKARRIVKEEPGRADWWIEMEERYGRGKYRFRRDMTMEELLTTTMDSDEEFNEEYPLEQGLECFCGDD